MCSISPSKQSKLKEQPWQRPLPLPQGSPVKCNSQETTDSTFAPTIHVKYAQLQRRCQLLTEQLEHSRYQQVTVAEKSKQLAEVMQRLCTKYSSLEKLNQEKEIENEYLRQQLSLLLQKQQGQQQDERVHSDNVELSKTDFANPSICSSTMDSSSKITNDHIIKELEAQQQRITALEVALSEMSKKIITITDS